MREVLNGHKLPNCDAGKSRIQQHAISLHSCCSRSLPAFSQHIAHFTPDLFAVPMRSRSIFIVDLALLQTPRPWTPILALEIWCSRQIQQPPDSPGSNEIIRRASQSVSSVFSVSPCLEARVLDTDDADGTERTEREAIVVGCVSAQLLR